MKASMGFGDFVTLAGIVGRATGLRYHGLASLSLVPDCFAPFSFAPARLKKQRSAPSNNTQRVTCSPPQESFVNKLMLTLESPLYKIVAVEQDNPCFPRPDSAARDFFVC